MFGWSLKVDLQKSVSETLRPGKSKVHKESPLHDQHQWHTNLYALIGLLKSMTLIHLKFIWGFLDMKVSTLLKQTLVG